jgi:uncharacterized membrane protein YgaE (UPF0421/DUF939 family)
MTWSRLVAALQPSIRAALAAGLSIAIARLLRLQFPIYAMIAVIVTDLSPSRTRPLALGRLVGTVLGAALGIVIEPCLKPSAWVIGLGILAVMLLSHLFGLHDAANVAGYVCGIVMLDHGADPWSYALYRVIETDLGIGLALLVSLVPILVRSPRPDGDIARDCFDRTT